MANRMKEYFEQDGERGGLPSDGQEAFAICPAGFVVGLTPEQFAAQQQIYRIAFAKAHEQVTRRRANGWLNGDSGDGI
jgi:hypothetical protein